MAGVETRSVARDSMFMLADIRVEHSSETHRVRVRNLSDGGMMGEGHLRIQRGLRVVVELRNVGTIGGSVAWVQDDRFGVAFDEEINSQLVRRPLVSTDESSTNVTKLSRVHRAPRPRQGALRKI